MVIIQQDPKVQFPVPESFGLPARSWSALFEVFVIFLLPLVRSKVQKSSSEVN
jgi:hypothetical protein